MRKNTMRLHRSTSAANPAHILGPGSGRPTVRLCRVVAWGTASNPASIPGRSIGSLLGAPNPAFIWGRCGMRPTLLLLRVVVWVHLNLHSFGGCCLDRPTLHLFLLVFGATQACVYSGSLFGAPNPACIWGRCGAAQHRAAQHSTRTSTSTSTARHGTAQHGTAQHSTAQHSASTAQHSTAPSEIAF